MSVFGSFLRFPWYVLPVLLPVTITGTAQAATTGTQTFKAAITTGTCSIPGSQMTQTIDFGTISKLSTWTGSDTEAVTVGVPVVSRKIHFDITDCPDTITVAAVEVDFTPYADKHPDWIKNAGSAQGLAMAITDAWGETVQSGHLLMMSSDAVITGGATTINGAVHVYRIAKKMDVSSGSLSGQVSLTLGMF
ncbi:hypothetical protein BZU22_24220 [Salmonella enterica subsp. enterica serovar Pomona]|nr:hypothetical protein [Salmonella enterica subsp. enterica serovar Pomona]